MDTYVPSDPSIEGLNPPVHRLPEEILLEILFLVLEDTPPSERYERLGELMLVCSQWGALIDTPSLWAYVSSYQSISVMKKSLFKSKNAPLDVVYTSYASEPKPIWSKRKEIDDLLLTNAHRWRSFEFQGSAQSSSGGARSDATFMDRLHHITAPGLNSISLRSPKHMAFGPFFIAKADRLRHIFLQRCSIPWDSGLLSGLKTLKIRSLDDRGPSPDQFISFLQASPGLVELSIGDWEPGSNKLLKHAEPIDLHLLETLKMWHVSPHIADHLLAVLRIPNCTKFHLTQYNHRQDSMLFGPTMEPLFPMLRAIMASCDYTHLEVYKLGLFVTSEKDEEEMLKIESSKHSTPEGWPITIIEGLRNLVDSTTAASSVHLTIRTDVGSALFPTALHLMESSCPIERLTLVQQEFDWEGSNQVDGILELLAKSAAIDGVNRWLLPNMKILEIIQETWRTQEWLVYMVLHRYVDRGPREPYELPEMLQDLRLEGPYQVKHSYLEMIEGILGLGVVDYTPPELERVSHHYDSSDE
ncbi:hypothetical protein FRB93_010680 [Tulasnella sp. JGI-2019a]|nr:hypothetical protein FRB93_010680 [Tulasnella sp. JGI-2019a]